MKGWFQRFMSGRYGFDQFGGFLCIASLILIVIGAWVSPILYWLGLAAIIYSYFRILSRNTRKRYAENLKYLSYQNRVTTWLGKYQVRFKQRKDYHYYRFAPSAVSSCARARGRGKISITCPKCGNQFIKKRVDARCLDMLRFIARGRRRRHGSLPGLLLWALPGAGPPLWPHRTAGAEL